MVNRRIKMFILIIVLVIIAAIFLSWLKPFLEYKKLEATVNINLSAKS